MLSFKNLFTWFIKTYKSLLIQSLLGNIAEKNQQFTSFETV